MDDDDLDMPQLLQALLQRLTARSREVSAAQEHGPRHATQQSSIGGHPLAGGAVGSADQHHEPVPSGDHLHLSAEPFPFEHEAASLEQVTEMLQRGSPSRELFDQIMEFSMRLPDHDDIGDILEGIYQQALAAQVLIPLPEWLDQHDGVVDGGDGRGFGGGVLTSSGVVAAGLEKRKYHQRSSGQDDDDNQCPICLMEYAVDDDMCVMPCKHGFHQECLARWLARSCFCPLCRHDLTSEDQDVCSSP